MWGHYAENHTGFALEYDFKNINLICSKHHSDCGNIWMNYPIFPVIYGETYDGTEYATYSIYNSLMQSFSNGTLKAPFFDWTFFTKGYLYKSKEWMEELEWRLLSKIEKVEGITKEFDFIDFKPKAIYCGTKINVDNLNRLKNIAITKEIELYQMKVNSKDRTLYYDKVDCI